MNTAATEHLSRTDGAELKHLSQLVWLGLFGVGLYTGIHLSKGGAVLLPYVLCALAAPYLTLKVLHLVDTGVLRLLFTLACVSGITLFLAPEPATYFVERAKGFTYLVYSLWLAYCLFVIIRSWPKRLVARAFGVIAFCLVVGATLESYTPLKIVSDAVRHAVFDPSLLYENNARDIALAGRIRPKFFTEEPSYIALWFVLAAYGWFGLSLSRFRHIGMALLTAAAFAVIRSPVVLLLLPAAAISEFVVRRDLPDGVGGTVRSSGFRSTRRIALFLGLVVVLGVAASTTILARRIERIRSGADPSTLIRVVAPVYITQQVLARHPIVGVGLSGKEMLDREVRQAFRRFGIEAYATNRLVNAFWLFWIFHGVVGGLTFGYVLVRLMRRLSVAHRWSALAVIALFGQAMGAFVGLRFWVFVFMVFLIAERSGLHADGERVPSGKL